MIQEIDPEELKDFNPVSMFKSDWALISAGNMEKCNTMTASWGGFGHLWNKPVAFIFIRPQRYTFEFVENNDEFTISFFDESYKKTLKYLGTVSGRTENKIKKANLTKFPIGNSISFEESNLVILGKKIYVDWIKEENFLSEDILKKVYPHKDFHKMYIIEIEKVLLKPKFKE